MYVGVCWPARESIKALAAANPQSVDFVLLDHWKVGARLPSPPAPSATCMGR
jgi:hypothetical protein